MRKVFKKVIFVLIVSVIVFGAIPLSELAGLDLSKFGNLQKLTASVSEFFGGLSVKAETPEYTSGYYTYTVDENGNATITDVDTSISGDITIPSTLDSYPVTIIGDYAFSSCTNLTGVVIPDSVTSIGSYAFGWCSGLPTITIPDSITSINKGTFWGCNSLTTITIPDSVTSIGGAFGYCGFTSITIPDSVISIGEDAFFECDSLTSITIPDSVTTIGDEAFMWCDNLTSVTIGTGITTIGNSTFSSCDSLTSITIPNSVTSIGNSTFSSCDSLTSVTIPDSVTSIGSSAFLGCSSLTSITIPDSVTNIGDSAFSGCRGLTSIIIGNGVTNTDGFSYFEYYPNLTTVIIGSGIKHINKNEFSRCTNLSQITFGNKLKTIGSNAFYECSNLKSITIPGSVTDIGTGAFRKCTNLENVVLGKSITKINDDTFYDCENITEIIIPYGIKEIGEDAFYNCKSLTEILLPDGITYISDYSFYNCINLATVSLPESLSVIGSNAFQNCASLKEIKIPYGVTTIESNAFYGCKSLTSIIIPDSVTNIESGAFSECTSVINVSTGNGVTNLKGFKFTSYPNLTKVTIGNNVTAIDAYSFKNCTNLLDVTLTDSITNIGAGAFYGCESLANIILPTEIKEINRYTFYNCKSLKSISFYGTATTSIEESAFANCTSLKSIYLNYVQVIGDYAFYDCVNISEIYVGYSYYWWGICKDRDYIGYQVFGCSEEIERDIKWTFDYKISSSQYLISLSQAFYTCFEGESVFVSGDMYAADGISNITLDWRSSDGVEVLTPASIINSDANNASFSVEVKGLSAGMHSVTVYASSGKSDSCIIKVIKPESELMVSVGGAGKYYFVDGKLLDGELNEVDEIPFKVTVENRLKDGSVSELTEELKEKLMIKDVKVSSALSDYSGLLIDIEDMNKLQNIGDLQVGDKKEFVLRVYPNNFELPEKEITLNTVASASEQSNISIVAPIEIKDKLYEPQAIVSFNVFNQNIIYNEKKYDSEAIEVSVRVTNRIPSSFSGNAAKLKEFSDCDITVSEIKISSDDSKLLSDAGIRTKELNTVLHAGESTVITGTYHINTKHKMDEKLESETVGFSCNVLTSANSLKASKSVTFVNKDCTVEIEKDKNIIEAAEKAADALLALKKEHKGEAAVALDMNLNLIFSDSEIEQIQDYILTQILLQSLSDKKIVDETLERFREYTDDKIAEDLGIDKKLKEDLEAFLGSFNSNVNVYNKDIDMDIVIETEDYGTVTINIKTSVMKTDLDDSNIADFGGLTYTIKDSDKKLPSGMFKTGTGMIATADVTNFVDAAKKLVTEEISQLYSEVWGKNFDKVVDIVCGKTVNDILALTKYKSAKGLVFAAMVNPVKEFCAKCPVDIFIYDSEGKLCAAVENDIISKTSEKALVSVNGSEKTVLLLDETYSVIFKPTGNNATMDITIKEFANSSSLLRTINFNDVPLEFGEHYSQTITSETLADESNYALTHDTSGEKIQADSVEKILHYHTIGEYETVSDAKCNQASIIRGKCTICFDTVLCSTDIYGVCKAGEWIVETEATLTSEGKKVKSCLYCGEIMGEEIIPKLSEDNPNDTPTNPSEPVTPPSGGETNVTVVVRNPSTTTISYGDAIILHADVTGTLPVGATIKWEASNGNFAMEVSADGTTCKISPSSKGDTTFTVSIVDVNKNVISSDEQVMTSKAGFFDKIIAFFKKLFGLTKTIPQIYKGIF